METLSLEDEGKTGADASIATAGDEDGLVAELVLSHGLDEGEDLARLLGKVKGRLDGFESL